MMFMLIVHRKYDVQSYSFLLHLYFQFLCESFPLEAAANRSGRVWDG